MIGEEGKKMDKQVEPQNVGIEEIANEMERYARSHGIDEGVTLSVMGWAYRIRTLPLPAPSPGSAAPPGPDLRLIVLGHAVANVRTAWDSGPCACAGHVYFNSQMEELFRAAFAARNAIKDSSPGSAAPAAPVPISVHVTCDPKASPELQRALGAAISGAIDVARQKHTQTWYGEMREHPVRIWSYGGFVHEADPREKTPSIGGACEYVRADLVPGSAATGQEIDRCRAIAAISDHLFHPRESNHKDAVEALHALALMAKGQPQAQERPSLQVSKFRCNDHGEKIPVPARPDPDITYALFAMPRLREKAVDSCGYCWQPRSKHLEDGQCPIKGCTLQGPPGADKGEG